MLEESVQLKEKMVKRLAKGVDIERLDVPIGWQAIIDALDEQLSFIAPDYTIKQIKSRFGELRFYADFPSAVYDEAERLIGLAAIQCKKTCELCGAPGDSHHRNHWVYTICDTCLTALPAELPQESSRKPTYRL